MVSIFEVRDVASWLAFAAWVLAVVGASRGVFRSFIAAELRLRLDRRYQERREEARRAAWSLQSGLHWSAELQASPGSPHVARMPLDEKGKASLRGWLDRYARGSRWQRAVAWFFACALCQSFVSAAALFAITRGVSDPLGLVLSSFAYTAAATMLISRFWPDAPAANRGGCASGNC